MEWHEDEKILVPFMVGQRENGYVKQTDEAICLESYAKAKNYATL